MSGVTIELNFCSFVVPLSDPKWKALTALNRDSEDVYDHDHPAVKKMLEAGCEDLEWNGHYGRNFFFSCGVDDIAQAQAAVIVFIKSLQRRPGRKAHP